jgi:hypothetical protein
MSLVSFLNRPQVLNFFDTPTFQRNAIGVLIVNNAVLRPVAALLDKNASEQERKYSAARELFHQLMCLVCHYLLASSFEKSAFLIAKRFPAVQKEFPQFRTFQDVKSARKFNVEARRNNRLIAAGVKRGATQAYRELPQVLRGVLRMGDSLGTILALTCIAPILNNYLLGPTMKMLKLSAGPERQAAPPPNMPPPPQNVFRIQNA